MPTTTCRNRRLQPIANLSLLAALTASVSAGCADDDPAGFNPATPAPTTAASAAPPTQPRPRGRAPARGHLPTRAAPVGCADGVAHVLPTPGDVVVRAGRNY